MYEFERDSSPPKLNLSIFHLSCSAIYLSCCGVSCPAFEILVLESFCPFLNIKELDGPQFILKRINDFVSIIFKSTNLFSSYCLQLSTKKKAKPQLSCNVCSTFVNFMGITTLRFPKRNYVCLWLSEPRKELFSSTKQLKASISTAIICKNCKTAICLRKICQFYFRLNCPFN